MTGPDGGSRGGSDAASAQAFKAYVEPELEVLLRVATTLTGRPADAEDLVQETVIRAYRAMDSFDGRHPRAWLMTILRRTNMNMHRRTQPDLVEDWARMQTARPAFGAAESASAETCVVDNVLSDDLEQAVATLEARFRAVLLLVDVDGSPTPRPPRSSGSPSEL